MTALSSMPDVSIVVPVYNAEKTLPRCVDSLLAQTVPFKEIILIDDGSTDGSRLLCDEYANRYPSVLAIHQRNAGVSAARNKGLEKATGRYLSFADGDDILSSSFNEVLLPLLEETESDVAIGDFARIGCEERLSDRAVCVGIQQYSSREYLDVFFRVKGNRCVHYPWGKYIEKNFLRIILFQRIFQMEKML